MRILVIRRDCMGDVLVGTSVLPGLREKYPQAQIHFAASPPFQPMLWNNPRIDKIVTSPTGTYDLTIELGHEPRWNGHNPPVVTMAQAHCDCAGVRFHKPELFLTPEELAFGQVYAGKIAVANQCGWASRRYNQMPELVALLEKRGADMVQIDNGPNLGCPQAMCSIRHAAAILSFSSLYLGVDTVFMHMASALGVPMVLAMGATDIENQYIPNATVVRQFPWTNTSDMRYVTGINLDPALMLAAINTRWPALRLQNLPYTSYTDDAGRRLQWTS